jgi:predicted nucleotide-binding protein
MIESPDEWITAADALKILKPTFRGEYIKQMTICSRAHAGLVRARAERYIVGDEVYNNVQVPTDFWWAEGNTALHQNWTTGDFDTWVDRGETHLRAFGLTFLRADIDKMTSVSKVDAPVTALANPTGSRDVFIVHGRDDPAKIEVARLIERSGLNAVILQEQPNAGRTIIEKFESHAGSSGFAVVILTVDDVGGAKPDELRPRARQNVIGEMFWFAGRLGRNRVCALKKGDVEMPSDFAGVGYTEMDDRGAWKAELLRELQTAGYKVDWGKALA